MGFHPDPVKAYLASGYGLSRMLFDTFQLNA
jgi:hypothetical protein